MIVAMLVMAQGAAAAAEVATPLDFNLRSYHAISDCMSQGATGIVVCAEAGGRNRLAALDHPEFEPEHIAASVKFGHVTTSAALSAVEIGPGLISNRMMISIKLPF